MKYLSGCIKVCGKPKTYCIEGPVFGDVLSEQVPHEEGVRGGGDEEGGHLFKEGG